MLYVCLLKNPLQIVYDFTIPSIIHSKVDEALETLTNHYSLHLCDIIRQMLM